MGGQVTRARRNLGLPILDKGPPVPCLGIVTGPDRLHGRNPHRYLFVEAFHLDAEIVVSLSKTLGPVTLRADRPQIDWPVSPAAGVIHFRGRSPTDGAKSAMPLNDLCNDFWSN